MTTRVHENRIATFDKLKIEVYSSAELAGVAAANAAAEALLQIAKTRVSFGVIFATGMSQLATLRALSRINQLPWGHVQGFHMDDYVGLPDNHPASFHAYLRDKLLQRVQMKSFLDMDGNAPDVAKMCRDYSEALRAADPQLCLLGIGENGHLAFNDPAEANFNDPFDIRTVHLDEVCRQQQAAEGWFKSAKDVPVSAVTLTIPTLIRVPKIIISMSGKRKAHILRRTLVDPMTTACPSTILRTHADTTIFLDEEAAAEVGELLVSAEF